MSLHSKPALQRLVIDESAVAPSRGLRLERAHEQLLFRWDAPPGARPILARFEEFFAGTQPAEVLRGFLWRRAASPRPTRM